MNQQQGSYIDLKNCTIYIQDASSYIGAVNHSGGYAAAATTAVVDGFTGQVPAGNTFVFAGHATIYTVVSTIETSGATTSITFTPGLTTLVADNEVITVGPNQLEIKVGDGTLTYTETKNREYKLNRGIIDKVRNGDQAPMEVAMTLAWTYITANTGAVIPTVEDFLKRRGPAAAYISTGQGCDPFAVNLIIRNAPTACVGEAYPVETITFPEFRYEKLAHDAKAGTISCDGKCNATEPTVVRSAS